jgi:carboxypeptidase C (cathepsin A)|tara:strand:- start:3803 stop:5104 length:1302 start_codon:yes stop_codon:yes gene_type:complete
MLSITHIPGYNKNLPSKMLGGYINIDEDKHIYSIFIEAEKNAKKAPIIFWTNGGPGCSGLMGLFEEFGPLRVQCNGKVDYNQFTWTKFANIVFIEQPIGVGFSWSSKKKDYKSDDELASQDNLTFILKFFEEFPQFKKNKLYLSSESYGGHYIPLWVDKIIKYNKTHENDKLNLKGFMIGNPYVSYESGIQSQILTYWGHQIMPIDKWEKFKKHKCATKKKWRKKHLYKCNKISYEIEDCVGKHNPYALSYPICKSHQQSILYTILKKNNKTLKKKYTPCINNYTHKYLNRKDVKQAIHVKNLKNSWKVCSDRVVYKYSDTYISQIPLINKILNDKYISDLDILIMSGTNDSICGTIKTQEWIKELDIKSKKKWKQYFIHKEPAGYLSTYKSVNKKMVIFATVNHAGHEIPLYKPEVAYNLMKMFVEKKFTSI